MGLQQLARDVEILDFRDAQKHDRQIAGNAVRPEPALGTAAAPDRVGGRAQRRCGIEEMPRQTLEQARFARIDAEVMELHLRLRPGQRGGAIKRRSVTVLVDEVEQPRRGSRRTSVQKAMRAIAPGAMRTRRRKAKIGIEYRAGRV